MDKEILIKNLKEALKELNEVIDVSEAKGVDPLDFPSSVDTIQHLIEKTINDLKKEPYIKSYQLTTVWSDGMVEQFSNIPSELGKMFIESLKTLEKVTE